MIVSATKLLVHFTKKNRRLQIQEFSSVCTGNLPSQKGESSSPLQVFALSQMDQL